MSIQYGSILRWPGRLRQPHERVRAPFKAGHSDTLQMLERELRMISAESAVVQLALGVGQFTQDGRPYYQAKPSHPGVIVSFSKPVRLPGETRPRKVPLMFPADKFTSWEANLRAVAIALEDLRRIDRYGVTQTAEQYTGFKALPGPLTAMPTMTTEEAAGFVCGVALTGSRSAVLSDAEAFRAAYRAAATKLHPDANGGDPRCAEKWERLQEAKRLLDALHAPRDAVGQASIVTA